jgi:serine protease inhibitor
MDSAHVPLTSGSSGGAAVAAQTPNGNVAISPLSLAMALQITYNGAAGAAAQGMAQTLQLGTLSTSQLNADNAALQALRAWSR